LNLDILTALDGFFWFLATLALLVILQRFLHREIQVFFLLLTRRPGLTQALFALLFLPGVFLHEASHFLAAKLLGVRTGRVSLIPRPLPDGKLQLGFVETARGGLLKDALIGAAPLFTGGLLVAFIAVDRLDLQFLWELFRNGQFDLFQQALVLLPSVRDFWLWFYLAFTVSSMMLPSASDRSAWPGVGMAVGVLLGVTLLAGGGTWLLERLAPPVNAFMQGVAMLFGLCAMIHALLVLPFFLLHRLLAAVTRMDAG